MPRAYAPLARTRLLAPNAEQLYITRRDLSSGENNRVDASQISENQTSIMQNADIGIPGRVDKRPGINLIADDVGTRTDALIGYYPTGASGRLYRADGGTLRKWTGTGNWSTIATGFASGDSTFIRGGESGENEVVFFQDDSGNPQRIQSGDTFQDLGSGATSPPKTLINHFFRNRWWALDSTFLYYSDAFSTDYSTAFAAANGFRFSGFGADRGLISVRDQELIIFMQNGIFSLAPTATPAATDKPQVLTVDHGCAERKTIQQVGDDILYLAPDGIRSLKRTIQDKLQLGVSYPLSFQLKDEFDNINWAQVSKFHSIYFQDKYIFWFCRTPSTTPNRAWIYWPATNGWAVATGTFATVNAAAKWILSGEERLYGGGQDGKVYELWVDGDDDEGTAISMSIETREEDFQLPGIYKYGGELEVVFSAVGDYDVTVSAAIDGGDYTTLGTMNLSGGAPILPVDLPFDLESANRKLQKFHLDVLGRWRRIKFKFAQTSLNTADKIRMLEYSVATCRDMYESE